MSLDRSLKSASSLVRHRNVLTRAERLDKLKEEEKWNEDKSVFGLPKVGHRKAAVVKIAKEEAAADGTTPVPVGAAAAGCRCCRCQGRRSSQGARPRCSGCQARPTGACPQARRPSRQ